MRLGLQGMRERAAILGGSIDVTSAPGRGTEIYLRCPLVRAAPCDRAPQGG
jgi:signal transduction histidine kinase